LKVQDKLKMSGKIVFLLLVTLAAEVMGRGPVGENLRQFANTAKTRLSQFANTATARQPARFEYERTILDFSIKLYRSLLEVLGGPTTDENVIFSPISITSVLNMILVGSNGRTEKELRDALQYPDYLTESDTNEAYKAIITTLLKGNRGVDVSMANRIFLQQDFPVYEDYLNKTESVFMAGMEAINFTRNFNARNRINDWVKSATKGNIPELIRAQLSPLTKMIVANAIHFKGAWQFPFEKSITKNLDFKIKGSESTGDLETIKVPTMINVMEVPYVESNKLNCAMIGLPYKGTQFGLFIIVPDGEPLEGLQELENNLTGQNLMQLIRSMTPMSTSIRLPRLKEESSVPLRQALRNISVHDLFDSSRSDLTRISNRRELRLDNIIHQAEIEVNEEGTEASAATAVTFTRGGPSKFFVVDKPFLYFIRDNLTGMPLFWGRVVRPSTGLPFSRS